MGAGATPPRTQEWPRSITNALAWTGSAFTSVTDYTFELSSQQKLEINSALRHFEGLGLDGHEINRSNFPLPTLGPLLLSCATELHSGRGFVNIRGIDPSEYSPEDNIALFLGISSYIGDKKARQDEEGNMLMHICDAKQSHEAQSDRPTRFSNRASTFHTDAFADIIALQTRSCAAIGGDHILSSALTVYNKIATTRPDLLEVMARPNWPFDSRGRVFESNMRPLIFYHGGKIILNFAREPLLGLRDVPRSAGFPELSSVQREALDLIEKTAQDNQLSIRTQPGDITFINNHALLHSREAFIDGPHSSRYLVRMWLKNSGLAWKLPRQLQMGNMASYDTNEEEQNWNVVPTPRMPFTITERLCS